VNENALVLRHGGAFVFARREPFALVHATPVLMGLPAYDATTLDAASDSEPRVRSQPPSIAPDGARYELRARLGEGGMGEVRLYRDRRIGREVAMKVVREGRDVQSDVVARFEREARVQGQLEHPSIVPVYDLGVAGDGSSYFTMKRVRGRTLEEAIHEGEHDAFTARRLLAAFGQVCQAIAFAHARGVLHRDLKPANVMLGEYGEVYVLDWGLAKLIGGGADDVPISQRKFRDSADELIEASALSPSAATVHGSVLGTPGYMAPEQVRGETDRLDSRTDVYALGAMLFELLALEPLHRRGTPIAVMNATLAGVDARPSARAPQRNVAPELDAIVVRACSVHPEDRYSSAGAMWRDLERFLAGDRDLERRRELAAEHAERARVARSNHSHDHAIAEASRALALDPDNEAARAAVLEILLSPPTSVPESARAEYEASLRRTRLRGKRLTAWAYLAWFIVTPVLLAMGIRAWGAWAASSAAILVAFAASLLSGHGKVDERRASIVILIATIFAVGTAGLIVGPFMLVPAMVAVAGVFFILNLEGGRFRPVVIAALSLALVAPMCLEWLGVIPPSYQFHDGVLIILPRMAHFPPRSTLLFLVVANVAVAVLPAMLAARARDAMRANERRVFLHNWHLRQFVPEAARSVARIPDSHGT
jgi:eukaryotic-like serine/threonine-protein kinase